MKLVHVMCSCHEVARGPASLASVRGVFLCVELVKLACKTWDIGGRRALSPLRQPYFSVWSGCLKCFGVVSVWICTIVFHNKGSAEQVMTA